MRRCSALLLAGALLAVPACQRGGDGPETISRERFVETVVALRTARFPHPASLATAEDSAKARADSARIRAAVLEEHGVTAEELQAFVTAHRSDTEELAELWGEITERAARADSIVRADSARADSAAHPLPEPGAPAEAPTVAPAAPPRDPVREAPPPGLPARPAERRKS